MPGEVNPGMRTEVENSETEDENCGWNENEIPKRKDLLRCSGLKKVTFENSEDINDSQDVTERRNPVVEGGQSKKREAAKVSLQLPTQPFQIWLQEVGKAKILTANPGALPTVVAKLAGQAWADMGSASRNVYEIRYNRALEAWQSANREVRKTTGSASLLAETPNQEEQAVHVKKKTVMKTVEERRQSKKDTLKAAAAQYRAGNFKNLNHAAKAFGVCYTTLHRGVTGGLKAGSVPEEFRGSGQFSTRLTSTEEMKVKNFVIWKQKIGYGLDWQGLQRFLQEVFVTIVQGNPERRTGLENCGQLPGMSWVRRFATRNNLVTRATMEISKGRQIITKEELALWQADALTFFSSDPKLAEAMLDPTRIWNQDESSVQVRVLIIVD